MPRRQSASSASPLAARFELLGGTSVVRPQPTNRLELVGSMRVGLPYAAVTNIGRVLGLTAAEIAKTLGLSPRTLERRKGGRLDPHESESIFRLADIMARAVEVLGDHERAIAWLAEPIRALGGIVPLALLDTEIGADAVRDVLGRIEHGVFS